MDVLLVAVDVRNPTPTKFRGVRVSLSWAAEKNSASVNKSLSTSSLEFTQGAHWRLWEFERLNSSINLFLSPVWMETTDKCRFLVQILKLTSSQFSLP